MKRKTIAIDFDDTICDTNRAFLFFNKVKHNNSVPYSKIKEKDCLYKILKLSSKKEDIIWDEFFTEPNFCFPQPKKEILGVLKYLKEDHKLVIFSAREKRWQTQINKWVNLYAPNIFDEIIFLKNLKNACSTKGPICKKRDFDLLIDDCPEEIASCLKSNVKVIVFDQPWNKKISKKVPRIKSFKQLKNLVNKRENPAIF